MKPLLDAPRWILIAALFFAPWFYGGTTEQGIVLTTWIVGAAVLLWLVALALRLVRRERIGISPFLASTLLVLALVGWWMALNAHTIYDSDFATFVRVAAPARAVAGSVDQAVSVAWMFRATALLGAIAVVADAARNPVWLGRFCLTSAATGSSIALLGLLQKATGAPMIFWRAVDQPVETFFATFFYHGNAGAFLNLTMPLTVAFAYRSFRLRQKPYARAIWIAAALLNVIAVFANTSRMGHVTGIAVFIVLAFALVRQRAVQVDGRVAAVAVIAIALTIFAILQTSGIGHSAARWAGGSGAISADARWISSQAAWRAVPEAGWLGFGPGTFHIVFPYFTAGSNERLTGFWHYLHEDYLQTVLEWGMVGSALWAMLLFGGIGVGLRARFSQKSEQWRPRQRLFLSVILLALATVALHALVDFPLQIASIQLYVATYLGICWSAPNWALSTR